MSGEHLYRLSDGIHELADSLSTLLERSFRLYNPIAVGLHTSGVSGQLQAYRSHARSVSMTKELAIQSLSRSTMSLYRSFISASRSASSWRQCAISRSDCSMSNRGSGIRADVDSLACIARPLVVEQTSLY